MIESTFLLPPGSGLRANPVLFGVSEGLARLLPPLDDRAFAESRRASEIADGVAGARDGAGPVAPEAGQGA